MILLPLQSIDRVVCTAVSCQSGHYFSDMYTLFYR